MGKDFLCRLDWQESHRHGQQGRDEELHGRFRGSKARNGELSRGSLPSDGGWAVRAVCDDARMIGLRVELRASRVGFDSICYSTEQHRCSDSNFHSVIWVAPGLS